MPNVVVVGGGISGLATVYALQNLAKEEDLELDLTLVEKDSRLGGKVRSIREAGFLCEAGPAAFPDNKPETLELSRELGLRILPSNPAAKKRFIYSGGRLRQVPESPGAFLRSDILSVGGKLRLLLEFFTKPGTVEDESIAEFGRRHLGREAEEKLISAMVVGIHAGDSEELSLNSSFPVMRELEKQGGGSLLKAMMKRMKQAKKARNADKVSAMPSSGLASFKEGVQTLTDALASAIDAEILTGKSILSIEKEGVTGYQIHMKGDEKPIHADVLILAVPAYAASALLKNLDNNLGTLLSEIPYVPASVVCLGYREDDVPHSLEGFGFLIPKKERRRLLGCRWDSSTFQYRTSNGNVLLWSIVGGAIKPDLAALGDAQLIGLVREELKDILGIEKKPIYTRIFRHEKAIPQYVVGHQKRIDRIEKILSGHPGLFLTGNAYKGIGIKDCTKNSSLVAKAVVDFLKGS